MVLPELYLCDSIYWGLMTGIPFYFMSSIHKTCFGSTGVRHVASNYNGIGIVAMSLLTMPS